MGLDKKHLKCKNFLSVGSEFIPLTLAGSRRRESWHFDQTPDNRCGSDVNLTLWPNARDTLSRQRSKLTLSRYAVPS